MKLYGILTAYNVLTASLAIGGMPGPEGREGPPGADGAIQYTAGNNIVITENVISVDTTDDMVENLSKPITSAGVYREVGNIELLLSLV